MYVGGMKNVNLIYLLDMNGELVKIGRVEEVWSFLENVWDN